MLVTTAKLVMPPAVGWLVAGDGDSGDRASRSHHRFADGAEAGGDDGLGTPRRGRGQG